MTMRVDAYTHFIPERFYKDVMSVGSHKDIGKRMMGVPAIFDINVRKKVVDKFKVGINPDEIKFSWDRNHDSKGTVWRLAAKWRRRPFRVASIESF